MINSENLKTNQFFYNKLKNNNVSTIDVLNSQTNLIMKDDYDAKKV